MPPAPPPPKKSTGNKKPKSSPFNIATIVQWCYSFHPSSLSLNQPQSLQKTFLFLCQHFTAATQRRFSPQHPPDYLSFKQQGFWTSTLADLDWSISMMTDFACLHIAMAEGNWLPPLPSCEHWRDHWQLTCALLKLPNVRSDTEWGYLQQNCVCLPVVYLSEMF